MRYLLLMAWILSLPCGAVERITVEGSRDSDSGHLLFIEPENTWEESLTYWLKSNSSLRLVPSTQASSTGFGIPSVRGRHPKYTEIYLQDWLLQDPLTSYPMVDDLDLRFLGGWKFR